MVFVGVLELPPEPVLQQPGAELVALLEQSLPLEQRFAELVAILERSLPWEQRLLDAGFVGDGDNGTNVPVLWATTKCCPKMVNIQRIINMWHSRPEPKSLDLLPTWKYLVSKRPPLSALGTDVKRSSWTTRYCGEMYLVVTSRSIQSERGVQVSCQDTGHDV